MAEARRTKEGKIDPGPIGDQVRKNVKQLREAQGISTTALSKLLEERVGRPISPTGITKVEMGDRRVDVGDLVALALVLKVTPNRLLLPTDEDVEEFPIMKGLTASEETLWAWAQGQKALYVEVDRVREALEGTGEEDVSPETAVQDVKALILKEEEDFRRNSLPIKHRLAGEDEEGRSIRDLFELLNRSLSKITDSRKDAPSDMDLATMLVERLFMVARQTIVLINAKLDSVASTVPKWDTATVSALRDAQERMELVTAELSLSITHVRNAARRVDDVQVIASNVPRARAAHQSLKRARELYAAIEAAKAKGEIPDPADEAALAEAMEITDANMDAGDVIIQALESLDSLDPAATPPDPQLAPGAASPGSEPPVPRRAKQA